MAKRSPKKIYQIKVTLYRSKPSIWRRLLVLNSIALSGLHKLIQDAMGWEDGHLHQFTVNGNCYGDIERDFDVIDEREVRLNDLMQIEKARLSYEYDFGDSWEHKIILEKILPFDPKTPLPHCLAGKRACPLEDIGGIWGYEAALLALKDPKHPDHEEYLEQIGEDFDPEEFDVDELNKFLVKRKYL